MKPIEHCQRMVCGRRAVVRKRVGTRLAWLCKACVKIYFPPRPAKPKRPRFRNLEQGLKWLTAFGESYRPRRRKSLIPKA